MKYAVVIRANGAYESWPLEDKLALSQYQMLVGGCVEVTQVRHAGKVCDMVLNEDGLGLGLPYNTAATSLLQSYWEEKYGPSWNIIPHGTVARVVGDVIILHGCRL